MSSALGGDNLQWGYREGDIGGPGAPASPVIGNDKAPRLAYDRSVGTCIIGGMRYRGSKWNADLGGKLLYGDHVRGLIWAATVDGQGAPVIEEIVSGLPTGNKVGLGNFCTDSSGEVFLMMVNGTDQGGGTIHKLVTQGLSAEPPALLSQTGVFTDLATLETAPGVISYDVASPLWSDAAAKRRWVILPNDGQHDSPAEDIVFSAKGNWVFPAGTVFVKHFEVGLSEADPTLVKRLETRFLICTEGGGKYGVTYKWNAAGTDAELMSGGVREPYPFARIGGETETRNWDYPSRADCMLCHNAAAGQALGFRTAQLNRPHLYESTGRTANQLATFNALGMFQTTLGVEELADYIEARALDDPTAPLEHRVRSYLDSNCSHCHQPGALVEAFDARLATPLGKQGLVEGLITGLFDLGPDGRYVKAGDPSLSALHVRLAAVGDGDAMPPLAKNVVDAAAVAAIGEWIGELVPSEFETRPLPQARYVRLTALSEVNGNPWTSVAEFGVLDGKGASIPSAGISVYDFDSAELQDEFSPATYAVDGNPATFWHTEWGAYSPPPPHAITLDLGRIRDIGGYIYIPRQEMPNGRIANYEVHHSSDGVLWTLMDSGTWDNSAVSRRFDALVGVRAARCQIAGPQDEVAGAFDVTVAFDMDVDDFDATDLQVVGGSVAALRGSGYYYVATILPTAESVQVSVPADAVDPAGEGSLGSQVLSFGVIDTQPPVPAFTAVPEHVSGPFEIGLDFGEEVLGLEASDMVITNGRLDGIVPDGFAFRLAITPANEGTVTIGIVPGAVTDVAANVMGAGGSVSLSHLRQVLARNAAEHAYLGGGMQLVADPAAPHGQFLWLPDGAYPGNYALPIKTQHRAEYEFVVPRSGNYRLRGLIRSPDHSSDSFFIEFDGNQGQGTFYTWDTQPVGATDYQWDYLNQRDGADPVVVELAAGSRRVTVYARDDGTRLDRIELESIRPVSVLAGPAGPVTGPFVVDVEFSENVSGLDLSDFRLHGGTLGSLSGSGGSYQVEVVPSASAILLSLPENRVLDAEAAGNFASNSYFVAVLSPYAGWAAQHGLDGDSASPAADADHDGLNNLLEYALGLDPASSSVFSASVVPDSGLLEYTYQRSISARNAGTLYQVEWSDSLAADSWSGESATEEIISTEGLLETVKASIPPGTTGRRFIRLRVEP